MHWLTRYRIRAFVRSSLWIGPAIALVLAIFAARRLRFFDETHHWVCFGFTPDGAKDILSAVVASMFTFIVVVASSLLLVVQLVSAGMTPRIIAHTLNHPLIRLSLSIFVFAYAISVAALGRIDQVVPQLTVTVVIAINAFSMLFFLYFVGALGLGLRPTEIMTGTAAAGRRLILEMYPAPYEPSDESEERRSTIDDLGRVSTDVQHEGASGVLLAFDTSGLVSMASRYDAMIELVPRVGDYITAGDTLFRIYGAANSPVRRMLSRTVALGPERTLEQDPRFAFRIIVDIASKALSPAINDPTTAVLAIDQIHRLLRSVGSRKLLSGRIADSAGTVRLIYATPNWEDFVWHGTAELRQYGACSLRVCQRLRAMLEHLIRTLPEPRRPPLREQLQLLNRSADRHFDEAADRMRVETMSGELNGAAADA